MGGLRRKPIPPGTDDEIVRALARSSPFSRHIRRFRHDGKPYIAYEGGVPAFQPRTLVATGYAVSVVADGNRPTADELWAALDALEGARGGT